MSTDAQTLSHPLVQLDYSLTGVNASLAVEKGIAEAEWNQCPVPRDTMRKLLERRDGPAIRDTILWFGLILASAFATYALWGSWWALLPYAERTRRLHPRSSAGEISARSSESSHRRILSLRAADDNPSLRPDAGAAWRSSSSDRLR